MVATVSASRPPRTADSSARRRWSARYVRSVGRLPGRGVAAIADQAPFVVEVGERHGSRAHQRSVAGGVAGVLVQVGRRLAGRCRARTAQIAAGFAEDVPRLVADVTGRTRPLVPAGDDLVLCLVG